MDRTAYDGDPALTKGWPLKCREPPAPKPHTPLTRARSVPGPLHPDTARLDVWPQAEAPEVPTTQDSQAPCVSGFFVRASRVCLRHGQSRPTAEVSVWD
jgi:hypothetical protein